jgi:hypothetical protein
MSEEAGIYPRALMVIGVGRTRIYIDEDGNPDQTEVATLTLMTAPDGEVFDIPVEVDIAETVDAVLASFALPEMEETPPMSPQAAAEVLGGNHAAPPQARRERVPQAAGAQRTQSDGSPKVPQF